MDTMDATLSVSAGSMETVGCILFMGGTPGSASGGLRDFLS
jgi:hypothetical protein